MSKSGPGIGPREDAPLEDKARTRREIGARPTRDTDVASLPLDIDFCYEEEGRIAPRPPLRIVKDDRARPMLGAATPSPEVRRSFFTEGRAVEREQVPGDWDGA